MLTWTSDDQRRLETVRVVITDRGLRANGHIVSAATDAFGVSYSLLIDPEGRSRRLSLQAHSGTGERNLSLSRVPGGQWVADVGSGARTLASIEAAVDIDLAASAFTNSLAIRRLGLHLNVGEARLTIARVGGPDAEVTPVEHYYRTISADSDGARIWYAGPTGERELIIDADGFVVHFPGLSDRLR